MIVQMFVLAADRDSVQLEPRAVHSSRSSSVRVSCSRDTAEVVMAGLDTDAPRAGPPVVFTICYIKRQNQSYSSTGAQSKANK